jgi:hypothetical protein
VRVHVPVLLLGASNRKAHPELSKPAQMVAQAQAAADVIGLPAAFAELVVRELQALVDGDGYGGASRAAGVALDVELIIPDGATT